MIESKAEIAAAVDRLLRECSGLGRGDVFAHEVIERVTGIARYQRPWNRVIGLLKLRMERERGITLWAEHSVGYKFLTVDQQIRSGHVRQVRARKQVRRGMAAVEAVPSGEMTMNQQIRRNFQSESLRKIEREITSEIHSALRRGTDPLPRIRIAPDEAAHYA